LRAVEQVSALEVRVAQLAGRKDSADPSPRVLSDAASLLDAVRFLTTDSYEQQRRSAELGSTLRTLANSSANLSCNNCLGLLEKASRLTHEMNAESRRIYAFYAGQEASRRSSAARLLWLMLIVGTAAFAFSREASSEAAQMQAALGQSEKLRTISFQVNHFGAVESRTGKQEPISGEPSRRAPEQEQANGKLESAMAELLALQSAIQLSSSAALVSVDTNFVITSWNPAAETLFGYSAGEAIGHMKPEQLQNPSKAKEIAQSVAQAVKISEAGLRSGTARVFSYVRRDQRLFPGATTIREIRTSAGRVIGYLWHIVDLSWYNRAIHEIDELGRALENTVSGWARLDLDGKFINTNRAYAETTGHRPGGLCGMNWRETVVRDDWPAVEAALQEMKLKTAGQAKVTGVRKDGSLFFEELTAVPSFDEEGRMTGSYSFIRDVTASVEAQRRLAASEKYLRESEAKLREAHEIAKLGTWEWDTNNNQLSWSNQTKLIFGLSSTDAVPDFQGWFDMIHPDDRDPFLLAIAASSRTGEEYNVDFRFFRLDGELRHATTSARFTGAHSERQAGTMLDITEQRRAQSMLEQSLAEKDVLLREIHHRVKNNLQVVSCLLTMQAETASSEECAWALRESERRIAAMALIHERLYGSGRMDHIQFDDYAQTLTGDLVGTCGKTSQFQTVFSSEPVKLSINQAIPCGLILNELVTNALKYAYPSGEGVISVSLGCTEDNRVFLSVADDGVGLPEDFEMRRRTSLGLTIVSLLVEQMNGSLEVSSNSGTKFKVSFPKEISRGKHESAETANSGG
jgi:PAS domain S-box-containing protein